MKLISLYVPAADNAGKARPEGALFALSEFAALAGGATAYSAAGFWRNSAGAMLSESVSVVTALVSDSADAAPYYEVARRLRAMMEQESVLLTIQRGLSAEFIEG